MLDAHRVPQLQGRGRAGRAQGPSKSPPCLHPWLQSWTSGRVPSSLTLAFGDSPGSLPAVLSSPSHEPLALSQWMVPWGPRFVLAPARAWFRTRFWLHPGL